jgi:hypothetical protein
MKRLAVLSIPPLALAACNSAPSVTATNASVAEVSNKVDAAVAGGQFVSPGRWETKVTILDISVPDMPPQIAQQMKAQMSKGQTHASCLTPEEAKKPRGDFFGAQKDCRYDHFTMAGGSIDARMICARGGQTQTMTMKGTYSADSYRMAMTADGSGTKGPMGAMSMKMTIDAKRTGACTGKEES